MNSAKHPAAFLDRDGTIVEQVELLHDPAQMIILPGAAAAIRLLNENRIKVIVTTNQPVVARGILSVSNLEYMHTLLNQRLAVQGAHVDAFYFCPHHVNADVKEFRTECECRKPKPGMLVSAAREYSLDLGRSVMIGDTTQDVLAGQNAGVKTILVGTGHGGRDPWQYEVTSDFTAADLLVAAKIWIGEVERD